MHILHCDRVEAASALFIFRLSDKIAFTTSTSTATEFRVESKSIIFFYFQNVNNSVHTILNEEIIFFSINDRKSNALQTKSQHIVLSHIVVGSFTHNEHRTHSETVFPFVALMIR